MKYRRLEKGEVIRRGDQWLFSGKWSRANMVGEQVNFGSYRRPIPQPKKPKRKGKKAK